MPRLLDSRRHAALAGAVLAACRGDARRPAAASAAAPRTHAASCAVPVDLRSAIAVVTPTSAAPGSRGEEER